MLLWLESQHTIVIALVLFGLCYLLAAIMFVAAAMISQRPVAAELKATTPVMMTPLGIIIGLLIAFLASRVWLNLDNANSYVAQEASAILQSILLADALPEDTRDAVRTAMKTYLQFIEAEDWPAIAAGRASLQQLPPGLTDAMKVLLAFVPKGSGQELAQRRAVVAVERALDTRRNRILLGQATIAPIQWVVILLLDVLILVTIAMVHLGQRTTVAANLFIFSTAIAVCLVLLMVHDRPFASGGLTVQPSALRDIVID